MSSYQAPGEEGANFYALDPVIAASVGLGTGQGYGTTASDGIGNPLNGTTGYGGRAPQVLAPQGIDARTGHFYFGFANTYPTTSNFSAYELGSTPLSETILNLRFRSYVPIGDINFIGICGATSGSNLSLRREMVGEATYLSLRVATTDPVFSPAGGADQQSAFGLYINYGDYDEGNQGVDYEGAVFSTNIHWWDIDVPNIPRDKLASIELNTGSTTEAEVLAIIPDSYLSKINVDPKNVKGYVDDKELPLGQEAGSSSYFEQVDPDWEMDFDLDGDMDSSYGFRIHNDEWSPHDIGVGVIPEPSTTLLILCGAFLLWGGHRRW